MQSLRYHQEAINLKDMKNIFNAIFIALFSISMYAQKEGRYVVVTIEKESNSSVHKNEVDYWIVDTEKWKNTEQKTMWPLYLSGFSATDYDECCINENLVLFNVTSKESFEYKDGLLVALKGLEKLISDKRKKVLSVKKEWHSGKKENIFVYLTPVNGSFCFCKLSHKDDNTKIGYEGNTAIPVSNFSYDDSFWESELSKGVEKFDYSILPFLSLQTLQ